jgi:hypothetical protein
MAFKKPATRKRKRLYMVLAGLAVLGLAVGLALSAFRDNIVFFYSPSEVAAKVGPSGHDLDGRRIRLGGLVTKGSVKKQGMTTVFDVKVRAWWLKAGCRLTKALSPPKCWPSMMKNTCRLKWRRRLKNPGIGNTVRRRAKTITRPGTQRIKA